MQKWTYNEVLLALYAYCHVPFNKASNTNPWIVKIAKVINRSPAAVKMKIGNLGVFDPKLKEKGITGLTKTSKIDELVWNDYAGHWDKLAIDAEKILSKSGIGEFQDLISLPEGSEKFSVIKTRINQQFFREVVLTSYNNQCCISGISAPTILEAAHIIGWKENEKLRTDPTNGLCMNPLFHKAYDKFLMTISPDFKIMISNKLLSSVKDDATLKYLKSLQNRQIYLPQRFYPNKDYLNSHYDKFYNVQ